MDLSPGAFSRAGSDRDSRVSRQHALAAEKHARRRPAPRTSKSSGGVYTGAVRVSADSGKPEFRHTGKLAAGLVLIASGILWTTSSTGKSVTQAEAEAPQTLAALPKTGKATIQPPAFFFDDSSDALTAHLAAIKITGIPAELADHSSVSSSSLDIDSAQTVFEPVESTSMDAVEALRELSQAPAPQIDHPSITALRNQADAPEGARTTIVSVAPGNTLSGILNAHGVKIDQMTQLLSDEMVNQYLTNLDIGQQFEIVQMPDGDFHSLRTRVGDDKRITIGRTSDGFTTTSIDLPVEKERVVTSGTIEQSLYLAAAQANLKQSTIMELANIFQWELDFAKDIRKGDQFALVYDRLYRDGSYIGDGDILAAEFVRGGKTHRAIRFTTDDGNTGYFSPDGQSMRRAFMRHPVDVVRITSKFDPNRFHPVLHQIRAHRGVDYGSPYGSPIYATADGKVTFSGAKSAYGNTVILQHGDKFSTLYAHMSKISDKSKTGKRVRQGDVIGYVGKSGRVTGTHLHYEFRVNGEQIDPLKVELPAAKPLPEKYIAELKMISEEMTAQMQSVLSEPANQVASALTLQSDDSAAR